MAANKFNVDPIKVGESLKSFGIHATTMHNGERAANALLWFAEYAKPHEKAASIINVKAEVVAGATNNAKDANEYLRRAVEHYREDILAKAVEMAKIGFESADKARK